MDNLIYKADKTAEDVDALLLANKRLVYYMLQKCGQVDNQDCESAAWEALWDAICTFDVYGKTRFSTYACTLLRNAIYGVMRKQQLEQQHVTVLLDEPVEQPEFSNLEVCEKLQVIRRLFSEYIASAPTLTRNILLAWDASGYEAQGKELAKICGSSASYVSRVQCSYRAFLQSRLRGQ